MRKLLANSLLLIACFIISSIAVDAYNDNKAQKSANKELAQVQREKTTEIPVEPTTTETVVEEQVWTPAECPEEFKEKIAAAKSANPETPIIGWLVVDGVTSEALVQSEDNDDWINKSLDGTADHAGSVIRDMHNTDLLTDVNTILWAHNMANDTKFGALDTYLDPAVAKEALITVYTEDYMFQYKVFSVHAINANDATTLTSMKYKVADPKSWAEACLAESEIDLGSPEFDADTQVITLGTCHYDYSNPSAYEKGGRLVVQAYLVK